MTLNKKKIAVVITARPSYSRIKTVLVHLKKLNNELLIITSASANLDKYGNVSMQIEKDGFEIKYRLYNSIEGTNDLSMIKSTAIGIQDLSSIFYNENPEYVITIADRFETLATSIAASYQRIKLIHIQGGEISGNIDNKVRNANTTLSDLHFVSTANSEKRILSMGVNSEKVFNFGCPSVDLALEYSDRTINISEIQGLGKLDLNNPDYLVVMNHPDTELASEAGEQTKELLYTILKLGLNTFWFWPNPDSGSDAISKVLRKFREKDDSSNILFIKTLPPEIFIPLVNQSRCLIGNSSIGIRESAILGTPVINLGNRQLNRERSLNVMNSEYVSDQIFRKIIAQIEHGKYASNNLYGKGDAGYRIANTITNLIKN